MKRIYARDPLLFFEDARLIHMNDPKALDKIDQLQKKFESIFPIPADEMAVLRQKLYDRLSSERLDIKVIHVMSRIFPEDEQGKLDIDFTKLTDEQVIQLIKM